MSLRTRFSDELKLAMKAGDKPRLGTIRLIQAALKDRDIEARGAGRTETAEEDILALLQKMVKQRQESASIYAANARPELAAAEEAEIAVITSFLPAPMTDAEVSAAIAAAIAATAATSMKDMGKVVAELKARHAGQMDFARASGLVKAALSG